MFDSQVRSKQRVADRGEVFTAPREVNAMLDLVKDPLERVESTVLEPSCGNGNFLAPALERRLKTARDESGEDRALFEERSLLALSGLYGIELLDDNARECRERLFQIWKEALKDALACEPSDELQQRARLVVEENIIRGNFLTLKKVDAQGNDLDETIKVSKWFFHNGILTRTFEAIETEEMGKSLFDPLEQENKNIIESPVVESVACAKEESTSAICAPTEKSSESEPKESVEVKPKLNEESTAELPLETSDEPKQESISAESEPKSEPSSASEIAPSTLPESSVAPEPTAEEASKKKTRAKRVSDPNKPKRSRKVKTSEPLVETGAESSVVEESQPSREQEAQVETPPLAPTSTADLVPSEESAVAVATVVVVNGNPKMENALVLGNNEAICSLSAFYNHPVIRRADVLVQRLSDLIDVVPETPRRYDRSDLISDKLDVLQKSLRALWNNGRFEQNRFLKSIDLAQKSCGLLRDYITRQSAIEQEIRQELKAGFTQMVDELEELKNNVLPK